jgi:hypothetical protein
LAVDSNVASAITLTSLSSAVWANQAVGILYMSSGHPRQRGQSFIESGRKGCIAGKGFTSSPSQVEHFLAKILLSGILVRLINYGRHI